MTDRPTDQYYIEKIFEVSGTCYYEDNMRLIIEKVIEELFYSQHQEVICNLRPYHISRAVFKFREAKGKTYVRNTKQYFKACILSAIKEMELDNLEPLVYEWED